MGYLLHFLPYFFVERTLFLHHYLPAFTFKVLLFAALLEHIYFLVDYFFHNKFVNSLLILFVLFLLTFVFYVFKKFTVLSYGTTALSTNDVISLRWKDTWDFIVHKNWFLIFYYIVFHDFQYFLYDFIKYLYI